MKNENRNSKMENENSVSEAAPWEEQSFFGRVNPQSLPTHSVAPATLDMATAERRAAYSAWLGNPVRTQERMLENTTPTELLRDMVNSQQGDGTTVLEQILITLVSKAAEGDMQAINKVYNELQHDGATKVEVSESQELSPAAMEVLRGAGFGKIVDVTPSQDD